MSLQENAELFEKSGYKRGAFAALAWAWRKMYDLPDVPAARSFIHKTLLNMGQGEIPDLKEGAPTA